MLVRGPPLSPGVVRGVGTTSRDPLPRAPLSVGAFAGEREILDGKRIDLQSGLGNRTHTTQKYNILPQSTTSDFARRA